MMRTASTLLAATFAIACTTHGGLDRSVSHGSPTTANIDDVPVKGFPAEVETPTGTVSGELLAVAPEGVYLLSSDGTRLVPADDVKQVSVELYGSGGILMAVWTVLGTVSTVSHGWFLALTAPTWIAVGASTAGAAGLNNDLDVPPNKVSSLCQFARFPAGLPASWPGGRQPPAQSVPNVPGM